MSETAETIRVLHVDDDPSLSDMVATFLEREDDRIDVQTATSADDGLEILTDHTVDCIVSDYDMPGQNGIEFLETVRGAYPDLPFILYTGKGSEEVASEAISTGVSDYLQKESDTDQYVVLANRIMNLVTQYRAEIQIKQLTRLREESEEYRDQLLEIVSNQDRPVDAIIQDLLELGCERFGVENGHLVMIDDEQGEHNVIRVAGSDIVQEGISDLSNTYCRKTIESEEIQEIHNAVEQGWADDPAYQTYGLGCYLGSKLTISDQVIGTLCFVDEEPREPFTHHERAFFDMLVRWFIQILERRRLIQAETIFENAQDAIFVIGVDDSTFTIRRVNRAYEELTGLESETIHDRTPREVVGEEQGAAVESHYRECVQQREPIEYEEQLTFSDDTKYWHTRLAPIIEDGIVTQLVGVTRDITERKQHVEQLQETAQRLELALTATDTGVWVWDMETDDVFWDENLEGLLGLEPGTFDGTFDAHAEYLHPDAMSVVEEEVEKALTGDGTFNAEFRMRREDGEQIWVEGHGTVIDDDGDQRMIGITRDITERKEHEQTLERQNERLEEFTGIVSHDLRNPLNVAQGQLELAKDDCDSDHLDVIARAHERMETLITDLLTLAREGETVTDITTVELAECVERCWRTVDTKDATLVTSTGRTVRADESRLRQLFENLIRNSIEHGGADVTATVGELTDGFYIEDDGPGIPPDDRGDVFDAGYSTSEEGTGFGLSIVKRVVDAHGWEIHVTEGSEGGARFEITGVEFVAE